MFSTKIKHINLFGPFVLIPCSGLGYENSEQLIKSALPLARIRSMCIVLESAKTNGRQHKTCSGQVFNYKLGCFNDEHVFICVDTRPHL